MDRSLFDSKSSLSAVSANNWISIPQPDHLHFSSCHTMYIWCPFDYETVVCSKNWMAFIHPWNLDFDFTLKPTIRAPAPQRSRFKASNSAFEPLPDGAFGVFQEGNIFLLCKRSSTTMTKPDFLVLFSLDLRNLPPSCITFRGLGNLFIRLSPKKFNYFTNQRQKQS